MLVMEPLIHRVSAHPELTAQHAPLPSSDSAASTENIAGPSHLEFDVELGELERAEGIVPDGTSPTPRKRHKEFAHAEAQVAAYPLTLGLVVHALADGFALGSSAISPVDSSLSLIVFLALLVHKGMSK